jgi:DNA-binding NarL/FixJ family response regulator
LQNTFRTSEKPIRILMLEDSGRDAEHIRSELVRANVSTITSRADSEASFLSELLDSTPDVVLAEHSLAEFDALSALAILRRFSPTTPLILVTGKSVSAESAVACIREGAEDLILKANLGRLATVITDAIELRRPIKSLTQRQIEVLRLVAEGCRTSDIAKRLNISVKTVESHRTQIMRRLDIHEIAGLVRYAIRVRLVPLTT